MAQLNKKYIVMIGPSTKLARGGMASVVLSYQDAGFFDTWPILYLETHKETHAIAKIMLGLKAWMQLLLLLFQGRVILLHAHIAEHISFLRKSFFMLTARCFGKKYIMHIHGSELNTYYDNKCGRLLQGYIRFVFNRASAIIVISEEWKRWILSVSGNTNIVLIHNPIQIPATVNHDDTTQRTQNVAFLGRLVAQKGVADLLAAFDHVLKTSSKPVHLWIGGDGDMGMVESDIKKYNLNEHVTLLGWIQGEIKEELLKKTDVLVLPSYNEVLPMVILEALAYSIPVIASRVGGIPDAITHGKEGFLINPGDIDAIAKYILELTQNSDLKKTMRTKARARAELNFSSEMILSKLDKLYQSLGAVHD